MRIIPGKLPIILKQRNQSLEKQGIASFTKFGMESGRNQNYFPNEFFWCQVNRPSENSLTSKRHIIFT